MRQNDNDSGPRRGPPTFGLSHIALKVANLDRAAAFYQRACGARQYLRDDHSAQVLGPAATDVIAFELAPAAAGAAGGVESGLTHGRAIP